VCYVGILIIGKGEQQDQKMAAIKRIKYTFASVSTVSSTFARKSYIACIFSASERAK
jgi:hypothetical protein